MKRLLIMGFLAVGVVACRTYGGPEPSVTGLLPDEMSERYKLTSHDAKTNKKVQPSYDLLKNRYKDRKDPDKDCGRYYEEGSDPKVGGDPNKDCDWDEWKFNRARHPKDQPPFLGLALSGGGVRSASFAVGVLKALHDLEILDQVDVISSVSGGSYIAYWYYSQLYWLDQFCKKKPSQLKLEQKLSWEQLLELHDAWNYSCYERAAKDTDEEQIFRTWWDDTDPLQRTYVYRFQNALEQRSTLTTRHGLGPRVVDSARMLWLLALQAWAIPWNFLTNNLFDLGGRFGSWPVRENYRSSIDRTYGLAPVDIDRADPVFVNAKETQLSSCVQPRPCFARDLSFPSLRDLVREKKYPFWIINMRGGYGLAMNPLLVSKTNENKLDALSNSVYEFTLLGHGSNLFGYRLYKDDEPLTVSESVALSGAAIDSGGLGPTTGTLVRAFNMDLGRHIANPGRPPWQRYLHSALPFPLHYVDDRVAGSASNTIYLSDGGHAENLGVLSLARRGVQNIIVVDAEHDPGSSYNSAKKLRDALRREIGLELTIKPPAGPHDVTSPRQSVLKGEIKGWKDESGEDSNIDLVYIKLAMDREQLAGSPSKPPELPDYGHEVTQYRDRATDFPQKTTADLRFSPAQFRAYRQLGYDLTCHDWTRRRLNELGVRLNEEKRCRSAASN